MSNRRLINKMKKFLRYLLDYKKNIYRIEYPLIMKKDLGTLCDGRYFKIETIQLEHMVTNPNEVEDIKKALLEKAKLEIADKIVSSIKINKMGRLLEIRYPICIEGL